VHTGTQKSADTANKVLEVLSFVMDAEIVAVDAQHDGAILPFQTLSTRARKAILAKDVHVHVCVFAFDLLLLNEKSLLSQPLSTRRQLLHELFPECSADVHGASFRHAQSIDVQDYVWDDYQGDNTGADSAPSGNGIGSISDNTKRNIGGSASGGDDECGALAAFFQQAHASGCEGLMCKLLSAPYEPERRLDSWVKLKKDYIDGLGDSLELVRHMHNRMRSYAG
jgi:DNA ligase-1